MESERRSSWIERATWASELLLLCVGLQSTAVFVKVTLIPYLLHRPLSSISVSFRCWVSPHYMFLAVQVIVVAICLSSVSFHRLVREEENKVNVKSSRIRPVAGGANKVEYARVMNKAKMVNVKTDQGAYNSVASEKISSSRDRRSLVGEADKVNARVRDTETANRKITRHSALGEAGKVKTRVSDTETANRRHSAAEKVNARVSETETVSRKITRHGALGEKFDAGIMKGWRVNAAEEEAGGRRRQENHWPQPREMWRTLSNRVSLIRKESMGAEELRLRADAFIKKVKDELRLQRLESEQRFMDMINRGL